MRAIGLMSSPEELFVRKSRYCLRWSFFCSIDNSAIFQQIDTEEINGWKVLEDGVVG